MDKKRIIVLCAMGLLLAAAIALGVAWVIEANEYAGYEADYVDIAEDVLRPDENPLQHLIRLAKEVSPQARDAMRTTADWLAGPLATG